MFLQRVVLVVVVVSRGVFYLPFHPFLLIVVLFVFFSFFFFFLVVVVFSFFSRSRRRIFEQRGVGFFLLLLLSLPSDRHALVLQTTKRASFFVFAFVRVANVWFCRRELGAFFRSRHTTICS